MNIYLLDDHSASGESASLSIFTLEARSIILLLLPNNVALRLIAVLDCTLCTNFNSFSYDSVTGDFFRYEF
jgi:hypothetical protein